MNCKHKFKVGDVLLTKGKNIITRMKVELLKDGAFECRILESIDRKLFRPGNMFRLPFENTQYTLDKSYALKELIDEL